MTPMRWDLARHSRTRLTIYMDVSFSSTSFCSAKANHGALSSSSNVTSLIWSVKVDKSPNSFRWSAVSSAYIYLLLKVLCCRSESWCWLSGMRWLWPHSDHLRLHLHCDNITTLYFEYLFSSVIKVFYHLFSLQKKWIVNTLSPSSDL